MDEEPKVIHERESGALAPEYMTDHDLLVYIARMLSRLEPLVETLEKAQPMLATMMPENGKKPNPFKVAMGAAKMAGGKP